MPVYLMACWDFYAESEILLFLSDLVDMLYHLKLEGKQFSNNYFTFFDKTYFFSKFNYFRYLSYFIYASYFS